jgi:chromosomal replication initiation ATPase DnaA
MVDEGVVKEMEKSQDYHIAKAIEHLQKCGADTRKYLADFVAALCNVPKEKMLANTHVACCAHARYLYWYAYRYMTNESYEKIAKRSSEDEHRYTQSAIATGVNKMSGMIEKEPLWSKRWFVLKRIIKLHSNDEDKINSSIVIQVPKEIKDRISITIKEK